MNVMDAIKDNQSASSMKGSYMRLLIGGGGAAATLVVLLFAESAKANDLDEWVVQNTKDAEKVLCKRQIHNEYFFMARSNGSTVKLGNRLDMTGFTSTHSFIVSWRFLDSRGQSLSMKVPPKSVKSEYVRSGDMVFAENVEYQTLKTGEGHNVRVIVEVKKCPTSQCDKRQALNSKEEEYTVELCDISLRE